MVPGREPFGTGVCRSFEQIKNVRLEASATSEIKILGELGVGCASPPGPRDTSGGNRSYGPAYFCYLPQGADGRWVVVGRKSSPRRTGRLHNPVFPMNRFLERNAATIRRAIWQSRHRKCRAAARAVAPVCSVVCFYPCKPMLQRETGPPRVLSGDTSIVAPNRDRWLGRIRRIKDGLSMIRCWGRIHRPGLDFSV